MSNSEPDEPPSLKEGSESARGPGWKQVDQKIWERKREQEGLRGFVSALLARSLGFFSSTQFLLFVAAPGAGLGAYLTFLLAYSLGGARMFGAYFLGIWVAVIVGVVAVIEKSGYSRNFEGWDFPLRRMVFLPVAFSLVAGLILLFFYVNGAFR